MILKIIEYPNKYLSSKAINIDEITTEIKELANNMLETMYAHHGIGLAANQVGVLKRIIVVDLQTDEVKEPMVLINPVIKKTEGIQNDKPEGCLSLGSISEQVDRHEYIEVEYTDLNNNKNKIEADGLLSICLQHEIDHLDGILFIDRISKLKRDLLIKKYKKLLQSKTENNDSN